MCNSDELDFTIEEKVISGVFLNNKKNGMIIYTEDTQNEKAFYKKVYQQLLSESSVVIEDIIQLGSCSQVKEACENDNDYSFPKLYVIDGDIYLMYNPKEEKERLFPLDRYCIENYFIEKKIFLETISRFCAKEISEIENYFNYDSLINEICENIIPLYYYYSILSEENLSRFKKNTAGYTRKNALKFYSDQTFSFSTDSIENFITTMKEELLQLDGFTEELLNQKLEEKSILYPKNSTTLVKYISGKDDILPILIKNCTKKMGIGDLKLSIWKYNASDFFTPSLLDSLKNKIISIYDDYKDKVI